MVCCAGSGRRSLLQQLRPNHRLRDERLRVVIGSESSCLFHTTAQTCSKVDWDYYEKKSEEASSSTKTKPPSIYDVHKRVHPLHAPPPPAPTKHRSEWDAGDWRSYRLNFGRNSQRNVAAKNDDDDDDDYEVEDVAVPRRRGPNQERPTTRSRSGREDSPPPLETDEAGRRFRPAAPWNSNPSRNIPRNGEVDAKSFQRSLQNKGRIIRQMGASTNNNNSNSGGELFSRYTKPPVHRPSNEEAASSSSRPYRGGSASSPSRPY